MLRIVGSVFAVALLVFALTAFSGSGNARSSQTNNNGVTTTQTNRGGEAKTKNGKGVVTTPGGKTCAKTANNQGCR